MDISEVSRQTGLPASTLRYYEEQGLIHPIGRKGLKRLFDRDILDRLALIALGRHAGFSLEEIKNMFRPDGSATIDRQKLIDKAAELDRKIKHLTALRDGLRHAADCPAPNHFACPKFQKMLSVARHPGLRPPRRGLK